VRHAEPEIAGVLLGMIDPGLSSEGRRHASTIALPPVKVIYTSQLRRARETAEALARPVPVVVDAELNEISYGEWDGLQWSIIEQRYPDLAKQKLADWTAVTPPGGEDWALFAARVSRALDRIIGGPLPAAVIAHLTVNAQIAQQLAGSEPTRFTQNCAEVLTYDV
jgi:broad specificity phosphatase PhoE